MADSPSSTFALRSTLTDADREAVDRLSRLNGPGELRAAILALMLTPGSRQEQRAWRAETQGLSTAKALQGEVQKLGPALQLPWLEKLWSRVAGAALTDRQLLLEAARRVMMADGQVRPIDRLRWLAMRHRFGATLAAAKGTGEPIQDIAELPLHTLQQLARFTAFLSRLVPGGQTGSPEDWYKAAMQRWWKADVDLPTCDPPDADTLVHALLEVQNLPWMLKPVLVRTWIDAALNHSLHGRLTDECADALRLVGTLLDCPMPPELARYYIEPTVN